MAYKLKHVWIVNEFRSLNDQTRIELHLILVKFALVKHLKIAWKIQVKYFTWVLAIAFILTYNIRYAMQCIESADVNLYKRPS